MLFYLLITPDCLVILYAIDDVFDAESLLVSAFDVLNTKPGATTVTAISVLGLVEKLRSRGPKQEVPIVKEFITRGSL